jgi:hypothetical protein
MMRITKGMLSVGGAAVVAGVLILSIPRAAHAVVAALVQVTNTASNPVITQTVGQQAGQSIQIACDSLSAICSQWGQAAVTPYTVPPGQFLVITAVDGISASGNTPCQVPGHPISVAGQLFIGRVITPQFLGYFVIGGTASFHASYPSGVVFGPGVNLNLVDTLPPETCLDSVRMYGYLTSN